MDEDDLFGETGDFFGNEFDEMDKQDKIHNAVDQGFDLWEDKCVFFIYLYFSGKSQFSLLYKDFFE